MTIEENLKEYNWTPLHTRILSHRIGDGTVNVHGYYVWDNKYANEFMELARQLNIKFCGPFICKKWGTNKIVVSTKLFQKFAKVVDADAKILIQDRAFLMENITKLPKQHQLQTIFALLVDDGCCTNWMLTLFEDTNKEVVEKAHQLWESFFPNTANIQFIVTPKGTKVYHIYVNREGIIKFKEEVDKAEREFGNLAGIWWKKEALEKRYTKAVSKRAKDLNETKELKEKRKNIIVEHLKEHNSMTFKEAKKLLNLSTDRTRLILGELAQEKELFVINSTWRARYSMVNEDISQEYREQIILNYLKSNHSICNREAQTMLNLGPEQTYVVLRRIVKKGSIKKIGTYQKACYMLDF